jgi:D-sedoheptulose 7-phosphate isomerase
MSNTSDFAQRARQSIETSIAAKQRLLEDAGLISTVAEVSKILVEAMEKGNKLILFGNGGSAADAQHIAAEFVGRFAFNRPPLPALALSVNTSCLTAIGNDYGYELTFSRQVEALGKSGDVAIGISTSGNSPNVLHGLAAAKKMGMPTVAFAGGTGGKMKGAADYLLCAPSNDTPRIQECHILIGHIISELVEATIFHEQSRVSRS